MVLDISANQHSQFSLNLRGLGLNWLCWLAGRSKKTAHRICFSFLCYNFYIFFEYDNIVRISAWSFFFIQIPIQGVCYNLSQRNLVTLQVTALLFIKGRSDMQMKLGTLFACRSFCFATSWRQSDLQCTMFYCMRREIFSDQFFGWIMVKGPDIKCIQKPRQLLEK